MKWVTVRWSTKQSSWALSVEDQCPAECIDTGFNEVVAETLVNDTVSQVVSGIRHPLWQLEIAKYAAQHLSGPLATALKLLNHVNDKKLPNADQQVFALETRNSTAVVHAFRVLSGTSLATRLGSLIRYFTALPIAIIYWILILGMYTWNQRIGPYKPELIIALHEELTNRTRHLLPPKFDSGQSPVFAVVGRPRTSLDELAQLIDPDDVMPRKKLFRPIGFKAAFLSWPRAISELTTGLAVLANCPVLIPFRECVAFAFRFILGACQAEWWARSGIRPQTVLFGHTGLADTTALEFAMQTHGTRTVHCVHGVSHGWNFAGYSDRAVFKCGFDARLAETFPAYGECIHVSSPRPAPKNGDTRWLLLTSYSHPMNLSYKRNGVAADLKAMSMTADAADRLGLNRECVVWRPHPAIRQIGKAEQEELLNAAKGYAFSTWPNSLSYEAISGFGYILTTPSTAVIDALRFGKLPLVLEPEPAQVDAVYSQVGATAGTSDELVRIFSRAMRAPQDFGFREAWEKIEPGSNFIKELL